jgi:hypothetical protein
MKRAVTGTKGSLQKNLQTDVGCYVAYIYKPTWFGLYVQKETRPLATKRDGRKPKDSAGSLNTPSEKTIRTETLSAISIMVDTISCEIETTRIGFRYYGHLVENLKVHNSRMSVGILQEIRLRPMHGQI